MRMLKKQPTTIEKNKKKWVGQSILGNLSNGLPITIGCMLRALSGPQRSSSGTQRLWSHLRAFLLFLRRDTMKPAKLAKEVTTAPAWHATYVEPLVRSHHLTFLDIANSSFSTCRVRPSTWIHPRLRYHTSQGVPSRSIQYREHKR